MQGLRIRSLQWIVGAFCAVSGAMMLVVPHQFHAPAYDALPLQPPFLGTVFLIAGAALIGVAALKPRRSLVVAAHFLAGAALLMLACLFATTGAWTGTSNYSVLGLGTALAPLLARGQQRRSPSDEGDALPFFLGLASALTCLIVLTVPSLFSASVYDTARPYIVWYGAAGLGSGLALAYFQVQRPALRAADWAAHLVLAGAFLAVITPYLQLRVWTAFTYYGFLGAALALLPWVGPRLSRLDPLSLRMQLALAFAAVAAVPLIITAALQTDQEEHLAASQALTFQENLAAVSARHLVNYIDLHRAAVAALATHPGLLEMPPERQQNLLRTVNSTYPDVSTFATFDATGNVIAASGGLLHRSVAGLRLFEEARRTNGPVADLIASPSGYHPMLVLGVPIAGPDGQLAGLVVEGLQQEGLAAALGRVPLGQDGRAYLINGHGRVIMHTGAQPAAPFADMSGAPPVAMLLSARDVSGSLSYAANGDRWFAGYARVPALEWGIVVERPQAVVLAGAYASRELTFGILLVVIGVALVVGAVTAGWLVAPLATLARTVDKLAAGNMAAPLPQCRVSEIAHLAAVFGDMRDRLAAHTAEHEQAEQALRDSEARFRAIFERAGIGILILDAKGRVLECNPAMQAMLGYSIEEIRNHSFAEFTHPDDVKPNLDLLEDMAAGRIDHFQLEKRYLCKGGRKIWGHLTTSVVREPGGEPRFFVGMIEDITEQKRKEVELRFLVEASRVLASSLDHEATLAALANLSVPTIADVCVIDVVEGDTVRQVAVACADPATEEIVREMMSRYQPDLKDEHPLLPVLRFGQSYIVPEISDSLLGSVARDAEHLDMMRGIGPTSIMVVPLVARGRTLGAISFRSMDAARRYGPADLALAEDLARRAALAVDNARLYQEAQEAVSARDEFLSVAAHELKTPMTSLRGFAQITLRQLDKDGILDLARVRQALQVIDRQSKKLSALVSQLLDVSRIEAGRLILDRKVANVTGLIEGVAAAARATTDRHTLTLHAPPEVLALVDSLRLEQVVTNLVDNAIKYSPDGGPIEVEVSRPDAETVLLAVKDHGIGIPPEHRQRIFDRFYQAHTNGHFMGMGLGLYISHQIVNLHGGRIEVEFPPDGGTRFVVSLPTGLQSQF